MRPTSLPASVVRSRSPVTVAMRTPVRADSSISASSSVSLRVRRSTCQAMMTSASPLSTADSIA